MVRSQSMEHYFTGAAANATAGRKSSWSASPPKSVPSTVRGGAAGANNGEGRPLVPCLAEVVEESPVLQQFLPELRRQYECHIASMYPPLTPEMQVEVLRRRKVVSSIVQHVADLESVDCIVNHQATSSATSSAMASATASASLSAVVRQTVDRADTAGKEGRLSTGATDRTLGLERHIELQARDDASVDVMKQHLPHELTPNASNAFELRLSCDTTHQADSQDAPEAARAELFEGWNCSMELDNECDLYLWRFASQSPFSLILSLVEDPVDHMQACFHMTLLVFQGVVDFAVAMVVLIFVSLLLPGSTRYSDIYRESILIIVVILCLPLSPGALVVAIVSLLYNVKLATKRAFEFLRTVPELKSVAGGVLLGYSALAGVVLVYQFILTGVLNDPLLLPHLLVVNDKRFCALIAVSFYIFYYGPLQVPSALSNVSQRNTPLPGRVLLSSRSTETDSLGNCTSCEVDNMFYGRSFLFSIMTNMKDVVFFFLRAVSMLRTILHTKREPDDTVRKEATKSSDMSCHQRRRHCTFTTTSLNFKRLNTNQKIAKRVLGRRFLITLFYERGGKLPTAIPFFAVRVAESRGDGRRRWAVSPAFEPSKKCTHPSSGRTQAPTQASSLQAASICSKDQKSRICVTPISAVTSPITPHAKPASPGVSTSRTAPSTRSARRSVTTVTPTADAARMPNEVSTSTTPVVPLPKSSSNTSSSVTSTPSQTTTFSITSRAPCASTLACTAPLFESDCTGAAQEPVCDQDSIEQLDSVASRFPMVISPCPPAPAIVGGKYTLDSQCSEGGSELVCGAGACDLDVDGNMLDESCRVVKCAFHACENEPVVYKPTCCATDGACPHNEGGCADDSQCACRPVSAADSCDPTLYPERARCCAEPRADFGDAARIHDTTCCTAERPCPTGSGLYESNNACDGDLVSNYGETCGDTSSGASFPASAQCCEVDVLGWVHDESCCPNVSTCDANEGGCDAGRECGGNLVRGDGGSCDPALLPGDARCCVGADADSTICNKEGGEDLVTVFVKLAKSWAFSTPLSANVANLQQLVADRLGITVGLRLGTRLLKLDESLWEAGVRRDSTLSVQWTGLLGGVEGVDCANPAPEGRTKPPPSKPDASQARSPPEDHADDDHSIDFMEDDPSLNVAPPPGQPSSHDRSPVVASSSQSIQPRGDAMIDDAPATASVSSSGAMPFVFSSPRSPTSPSYSPLHTSALARLGLSKASPEARADRTPVVASSSQSVQPHGDAMMDDAPATASVSSSGVQGYSPSDPLHTSMGDEDQMPSTTSGTSPASAQAPPEGAGVDVSHVSASRSPFTQHYCHDGRDPSATISASIPRSHYRALSHRDRSLATSASPSLRPLDVNHHRAAAGRSLRRVPPLTSMSYFNTSPTSPSYTPTPSPRSKSPPDVSQAQVQRTASYVTPSYNPRTSPSSMTSPAASNASPEYYPSNPHHSTNSAISSLTPSSHSSGSQSFPPPLSSADREKSQTPRGKNFGVSGATESSAGAAPHALSSPLSPTSPSYSPFPSSAGKQCGVNSLGASQHIKTARVADHHTPKKKKRGARKPRARGNVAELLASFLGEPARSQFFERVPKNESSTASSASSSSSRSCEPRLSMKPERSASTKRKHVSPPRASPECSASSTQDKERAKSNAKYVPASEPPRKVHRPIVSDAKLGSATSSAEHPDGSTSSGGPVSCGTGASSRRDPTRSAHARVDNRHTMPGSLDFGYCTLAEARQFIPEHDDNWIVSNVGTYDFFFRTPKEKCVTKSGSYGQVFFPEPRETLYRAIPNLDRLSRHSSHRPVAVKHITDAFCGDAMLAKRAITEASLHLQFGDHPFVTQLLLVCAPSDADVASFKDVYMVLQAEAGDLGEFIDNPRNSISPLFVKKRIFEILSALRFIHDHDVLHRDLKPNNVLYTEGKSIRLCDLGMAREIKIDGTHHTQKVFAELYRPPEILYASSNSEYKYNCSVDVWAAAYVFAVMLSDYPSAFRLFPENGVVRVEKPRPLRYLEAIIAFLGRPSESDIALLPKELKFYRHALRQGRANVDVISKLRFALPKASDPALDLLRKMLNLVPARRITAAEALDHEYFDDVRDAFNLGELENINFVVTGNTEDPLLKRLCGARGAMLAFMGRFHPFRRDKLIEEAIAMIVAEKSKYWQQNISLEDHNIRIREAATTSESTIEKRAVD